MSDKSENIDEKELIIVVHDTSFCKNHCKDYNECQNIIRSKDKLAAECVWNDLEGLLTTQLIKK
jgi:hypothetical protein